MRLLLLSDIHANPWALEAIERRVGPVDAVLVAGDAVNYGPAPGAVLDWLTGRRAVAVRGNHDQAVAFRQDPKAAPAKARLARTLAEWTRQRLTASQMALLRSLPMQLTWEMPGVRVAMVHATPVDPLHDYRLRPDADEPLLAALCAEVKADLLLVGHTHLPLVRRVGELMVINPGSVGQPLDGDPRTAFALWEDGEVRLCRLEYDRTPLLAALERLPLEEHVRHELRRLYLEARL